MNLSPRARAASRIGKDFRIADEQGLRDFGHRKSDPIATLVELPRGVLTHFTGTSTGADLSFTRNTTNFAGWVLLAFRPTTCTSSGPS
jgi:hypothetical protein